jgi:chaperonin cofactor prefoldin
LKLNQARERLEKRKAQLDLLNTTLQELSTVAQEAGVYPVDKNLLDMKKLLDQVNQVMAQVESRTTNTEWESVPLIGAPSSSSSRLKSVQQEVIYHLKKFNQKDGKPALSAWDVAHEYRDAVQVGSAKNIEAIRSSLL